jgi:hypothetical protein
MIGWISVLNRVVQAGLHSEHEHVGRWEFGAF